MTATSGLAIDARGVEVTYGDGTEAVRGVDLQIPEGEFFGFLGANGAGKTTTIKTLVTLLTPTAGSVTVNGYDTLTEGRSVRQSVGYMAQETAIDTDLTARENIKFACEAYGVTGSEREERIDSLLDLVDLADVADKTADGFSGGMKKRLDAATALVHEPPLVFLDEPTTGLDPKARNRLWEYFQRINDRGTTVFLTTQYLEEADYLCDRLSLILDGQIVETGSPDELKSRVGGERLDIDLADETDTDRALDIAREFFAADATVERTDDGVAVTARTARERGPDLLVALRDGDVAVTGFNVRAPSLDDVFLAVTDDEDGLTEAAQ
ncbi:ATP-binding cassette domain-containing protein [Halosegnis rubeus]|jgi:ABC-2 type transport system ATP-binding protein|uniref:ATP-binding cassette domain-containing protein n=1 Tax=Halosegnis rubeus TaxID=2212850 RepID=A0A5N5UH15_9EURY|nr:ABC transporter ATP-binding protein [Halosegnis rubeus]KAB7516044.1 ATP-binding cassette domain-containing protein [Halosegnis rubeus]KAB7516742.1 ATP-binding cassette domain-containing protein [Halosegnis rubeus]KAB7520127.1 ATP-binding cassette domain-containing protein [Halosegnis rubeus]